MCRLPRNVRLKSGRVVCHFRLLMTVQLLLALHIPSLVDVLRLESRDCLSLTSLMLAASLLLHPTAHKGTEQQTALAE